MWSLGYLFALLIYLKTTRQWRGWSCQQIHCLWHKKRGLSQLRMCWVDVLCEILWAYRKIEKTPIEQTPFSLAYSLEVIISIKKYTNDKDLKVRPLHKWQGPINNVHTFRWTKRRNWAMQWSVQEKRGTLPRSTYICELMFFLGSLVLKKANISQRDKPQEKFSPN